MFDFLNRSTARSKFFTAITIAFLPVAFVVGMALGLVELIIRLVAWILKPSSDAIAKVSPDWRREQVKSQIRSSFKDAVRLTTSHPIDARNRRQGFDIFEEILSLGENFNDIIEEYFPKIIHLVYNNFMLIDKKQKNAGDALYTKSRTSYHEEKAEYLAGVINLKALPGFRPEFTFQVGALGLWREVVSWNREKFNHSYITAICGPKLIPNESAFFILYAMNLEGIRFLMLGDGKILFPTPDARVNFRKSCLIEIEMHKASIDHVDFTHSNLFRINDKGKGQIDYEMSCVGTIFDFVNLVACNFEGADLEGASFVGTNISGSDFTFAENLKKEQFQQRAYWVRPDDPQFLETAKPKFPDDFPPGFADTLPIRCRIARPKRRGRGSWKSGKG